MQYQREELTSEMAPRVRAIEREATFIRKTLERIVRGDSQVNVLPILLTGPPTSFN
jgi:hypothetical protein